MMIEGAKGYGKVYKLLSWVRQMLERAAYWMFYVSYFFSSNAQHAG